MTTTTLTFERLQTYVTEVELATCLLAASYIIKTLTLLTRAEEGQGIRTRLEENSMKSF